MTETDEPTLLETAEVALALTAPNAANTLEVFVEQLPAELVPVYLARLLDLATNIRTITNAFQTRLAADGQVGAHFEVDGRKYGFWGAQQKGFRSLPDLFANLRRLGMSAADVDAAVSDARVTDLRTAADTLGGKRDEALELIEQARYNRGERGTPRFQIITEYAKR